jgi:hypothetical protein
VRRGSAAAFVAGALVATAAAGRADEGLWTLKDFPRDKVKATYGFAPDDAWLDRVRAATVYVSRGCTGTFVSASGLVLTNRNCAVECLRAQAADKQSKAWLGEACRDRSLRRGLPLFDLLYCERLDREQGAHVGRQALVATRPGAELACPNSWVRQLLAVKDVTPRMKRALDQAGGKNITGAYMAEARAIQREECGASDRLACSVLGLYDGARYELHKFKVFREVRLVFVPEESLAEFGIEGSPFTFPQHRFKPLLLRVYEDGKPVRSPFLPLAEASPREGEPVFMPGYPEKSSRHSSVASLQLSREADAFILPLVAERRGIMREYAKHKMDRARAEQLMASLDGQMNLISPRVAALSPELLARKAEQERTLRARIEQIPRLRERCEQAWQLEKQALTGLIPNYRRYFFVENQGFGVLSDRARTLVRAPDERGKPDHQRLSGFSDIALPGTQRWVVEAPFEFDEGRSIELLAFDFRTMQQQVGYGDPLVKKILQGRSPDEAAKEMIQHTELLDLSVRRALWRGGHAAIQASRDPFIALWRRIDADARAERVRWEREVVDPIVVADRQIAEARFEIFGTSEYPEANGTLRLRYGKVASTTMAGNTLAAFVPLSSVFGLATGKPPFELPERWLQSKPALELGLPFAFTADTDVVLVDGERGSPLLTRDLTIVGMLHGGNEPVAGGSYDFDPQTSRTVALTSVAFLHLLDRVYHADALVEELRPVAPPTK